MVKATTTEQILELVVSAERADGFAALNEAASLRLRHASPGTQDFTRTTGDQLVAYGQLSGPDPAEASLVVHPEHRRRGHGSALLGELLTVSPHLEIWAVHATEAAAGLARRGGLVAVRELWLMSRPSGEPVEPVEPPPGVRIRAFRPGHDEADWLAVNARAFASHPEQGGLTRTDLDQRLAEPWFDPAGFLLAEHAGEVVGFHWTKQHPGRRGEVYVLGVAPRAQDQDLRGLGRALLSAGLQRLYDLGNTEVILYVDGTNSRAATLYERAGFAVVSRDVQYAGVDSGPSAVATMQTAPAPANDSSQEIA